jgi:hypothetical protein
MIFSMFCPGSGEQVLWIMPIVNLSVRAIAFLRAGWKNLETTMIDPPHRISIAPAEILASSRPRPRASE